MEQFCTYCGSPRGDRLSCCGECHWLTRAEYIEYHGEEPLDEVLPHPADTPDYRTASEYFFDQAQQKRRDRMNGSD